MSKKWMGPWLGVVRQIPSTGVFHLYPTGLGTNQWGVTSGTALGALSKGGTGVINGVDSGLSKLIRCTFDAATALWLGTIQIPADALPPGFTVLNATVNLPLACIGGSVLAPGVQFSEAHAAGGGNITAPYSWGTPTMEILLSEGCGILTDAGYPPITTVTNAGGTTLEVYGDYEIV